MNIYIEKEKVFNENITEDGLCVYTALRYFYKPKVDKYFVSINHLSYVMFKRTGKRRDVEFIRAGLENLIENNYIKEISKVSSCEYILDLSNINYDIDKDGYYVLISLDELRRILNIKNIKKGSLLKYFLSVCSSFNNSNKVDERYKNKIAKVTIDYLCSKNNISYATCIKYNEILTENKLLAIHRGVCSKENSKNFSNYYSRYNDFKLCEEFISANEVGLNNKTFYANVNHGRSMAQKYNALCSGKAYELDVVKEIYKYCVEWNKVRLLEHENNIENGYLHELQQKDMTIFEKYKLN